MNNVNELEMELEYEDLVITTDEINHEDFPNNLTEEQRIVGRFYLPIMKEFGIKYSEYNHEDFQKNFTEEQARNLWNCLEIMERFGYELNLEVPPDPKPMFVLSQEDMDRKLTEKYG